MNLIYRKIRRYNFFLKNKNKSSHSALRNIKYGFFGVQALSTSFVTFKQINFIRAIVSKKLKNIEGLFFRIYIRVFLNYSITKKPPLTRMGKGSGPIKQWAGFVYKGGIFIEINIRHLSLLHIIVSIKNLHIKILPFKCRLVKRL